MRHAVVLLIGAVMFFLSFFIAFSSGCKPKKEVSVDPFEVKVPLSDGSGSGTRLKSITGHDDYLKQIDEYLSEVDDYEIEFKKEIESD